MKGDRDENWYMQLDFDWASDEKIVKLRAKYGKVILVDAINTFVLMAKCDGLSDFFMCICSRHCRHRYYLLSSFNEKE